MNEKIRFRGISSMGETVYGSLVTTPNGNYVLTDEYAADAVVSEIGYASMRLVKVLPESVSRYSGLDDSEGTPIYEGDKLRMLYSDGLGTVRYDESLAGFKLFGEDGSMEHLFDSTSENDYGRNVWKVVKS